MTEMIRSAIAQHLKILREDILQFQEDPTILDDDNVEATLHTIDLIEELIQEC